MKLISNTCQGFCRVVAMLLTLHFLNCSIDGRDRNPDFIPEDLQINDIETFAEFITEVVFKWHNAFEEHDEKDDESGTSIDYNQYYFSNQALVLDNTPPLPVLAVFISPAVQRTSSLARDVIAPPPEA